MEIDHYDIELDYDEKTKEYSGEETISLDGDENGFVIHSLYHEITEVKLNGKTAEIENGKKDDEKIIRGQLKKNSELHIKYKAKVGDELTGIYLAKTPDGSEMISTQFESISARRAFPCFDEPLLKATFSIKLTISSELEAISNMPVKKTVYRNNRKTVEFEATPRMPTYLLYIGIGIFKTMHRKHGNVDLYLSGLENHLKTTEFPLDVAEKCIDFFNGYTGIPYMLPKLHLISVPEFAAGAMENWGAMTFRESAILYNESSGNASKKRIASVIAHEIAHQWFGDLVTMKYWNDLWLNESFATFMANKAIESIFPEWNMAGDMLVSDSKGAFVVDSLESSNPVSPVEKDMDKMGERSTEITYGKGSMILRMVESYAGEKALKDGLHSYLVKYSYSNAEAADLWKSISENSDRDVSGIMDAWITREGYPLITVNDGNRTTVTQERFLLNGKTDDRIWPVPLTIKRDDGVESALLDKKIGEIGNKGLVKLNVDESGFYRVRYSDEFYRNMNPSDNKFSEFDKIGIASDLYALLISGKIELDSYTAIIEKLAQPMQYNLSIEISNELAELFHALNHNKNVQGLYQKFHEEQVKFLENDRNEDINRSILQGLVNRRLAETDEKIRNKLAGKFQDIESEEPDMRNSIAFAFIKKNGDIDKIIEKYESLKNDNDRVAILASLGNVRGKDALEKVFSLIKEGKIKKQDEIVYYISFCASGENRDIALENLERIVARLNEISSAGKSASRLLSAALPFAGEGKEEDARKLMDKIRTDKNKLGISKGLEKLEIFERLRKKYNN